jgi:hypothetical protein
LVPLTAKLLLRLLAATTFMRPTRPPVLDVPLTLAVAAVEDAANTALVLAIAPCAQPTKPPVNSRPLTPPASVAVEPVTTPSKTEPIAVPV